MRLSSALRFWSARSLVATCGLLGITVATVLNPQAATAQTYESIESLPSPVPSTALSSPGVVYENSPRGPLHAGDVRESPLWAGYQQDHSHKQVTATPSCGCGTCECATAKSTKKKTGKKLLGKLTHGLDVLIFGSCGSGRDCACKSACDSGCDTGCDSNCASYDTACDAIGPTQTHLHQSPPAQLNHHHAPPSSPVRLQPSPAPQPTYDGGLHQLPTKASPQAPAPRPQDPFRDDPISATGRATIKPASFRR